MPRQSIEERVSVMTVMQMLEELAKMPVDAVVLLENGGGYRGSPRSTLLKAKALARRLRSSCCRAWRNSRAPRGGRVSLAARPCLSVAGGVRIRINLWRDRRAVGKAVGEDQHRLE
jgi:hypothetical protein